MVNDILLNVRNIKIMRKLTTISRTEWKTQSNKFEFLTAFLNMRLWCQCMGIFLKSMPKEKDVRDVSRFLLFILLISIGSTSWVNILNIWQIDMLIIQALVGSRKPMYYRVQIFKLMAKKYYFICHSHFSPWLFICFPFPAVIISY